MTARNLRNSWEKPNLKKTQACEIQIRKKLIHVNMLVGLQFYTFVPALPVYPPILKRYCLWTLPTRNILENVRLVTS